MKNLFALSCLFLLTLTLQAQSWKNRVKGEGPVVSRDFDIADFEKVSLSTNGKLILTQGSPQQVRIEGQANILDLIKKEVNDKHWKIDYTEQVGEHKEVVVYATVPKLSYVKLSGSGDIMSTNQFDRAEEFAVSISGSGDIDLNIKAEALASSVSGSGNIDLQGAAENFSMKISGSGDLDAYNLQTENAQISISGSGDCKVSVNENLQAKINGSGDIYYKGRPRIQTKISGSGDLVSRSGGE